MRLAWGFHGIDQGDQAVKDGRHVRVIQPLDEARQDAPGVAVGGVVAQVTKIVGQVHAAGGEIVSMWFPGMGNGRCGGYSGGRFECGRLVLGELLDRLGGGFDRWGRAVDFPGPNRPRGQGLAVGEAQPGIGAGVGGFGGEDSGRGGPGQPCQFGRFTESRGELEVHLRGQGGDAVGVEEEDIGRLFESLSQSGHGAGRGFGELGSGDQGKHGSVRREPVGVFDLAQGFAAVGRPLELGVGELGELAKAKQLEGAKIPYSGGGEQSIGAQGFQEIDGTPFRFVGQAMGDASIEQPGDFGRPGEAGRSVWRRSHGAGTEVGAQPGGDGSEGMGNIRGPIAGGVGTEYFRSGAWIGETDQQIESIRRGLADRAADECSEFGQVQERSAFEGFRGRIEALAFVEQPTEIASFEENRSAPLKFEGQQVRQAIRPISGRDGCRGELGHGDGLRNRVGRGRRPGRGQQRGDQPEDNARFHGVADSTVDLEGVIGGVRNWT